MCFHLQHDKTDLIDALGYLLGTATQGNRTLRRVWQHFAGHLYGAACGLAYFLNLWATLAYSISIEKYIQNTLNFIHLVIRLHTYQLTIHIDWRAQSIEWVFEFYQLCQHHWTASTTETGFKLVMWSERVEKHKKNTEKQKKRNTLESNTTFWNENFLCTLYTRWTMLQYSLFFFSPSFHCIMQVLLSWAFFFWFVNPIQSSAHIPLRISL